MRLHKALVELKEKKDVRIRELEHAITSWKYEVKCLKCDLAVANKGNADEISLIKRQHALAVEEEKNKIRKEMSKSLIESDLKRVEAVARFETYKEMDTQEERKHIQKMLERAIEGLGNLTHEEVEKTEEE